MTRTHYLGGHTITGAGWIGPESVYVDFVSDYTSGWLWQLYANRKLIGRTTSPEARRCVGQLQASTAPAPLTLVRVDPAYLLTDFGLLLPRGPWNRFALVWDAESYPDDAKKFEITASAAAGEEVDPSNLLVTTPYIGEGAYRVPLPPIERSGVWKYQITPRDDASPSGNVGDSIELEVDVVVLPPDLRQDSDGNRFTLSAEAGVVTAAFEYVG